MMEIKENFDKLHHWLAWRRADEAEAHIGGAIKSVYGQLASELAGRTCWVKLRKPWIRGARGLSERRGEIGVITIDPGLSEEQKARTLLHEAAHIRLHFADMAEYRENRQQVQFDWFGSEEQERHDAVFDAAAREAEAREWAERWESEMEWLCPADRSVVFKMLLYWHYMTLDRKRSK